MSTLYPSGIPGLIPERQGKTRDLFPAKAKKGRFTVDEKHLLFFASDRISTHNIVHKSLIPKKGEVLTALTVFWLTQVFPLVDIPHHLAAHGRAIYDHLDGDESYYPSDLPHRAIVVKKYETVPYEFIYRNYLCGSLYSKYYSKGKPDPYGLKLPPGLPLMHEFPAPIFTPTDKSDSDDPILAASVLEAFPAPCRLSEKAFQVTSNHLRTRGIDPLDGKLEVGIDAEGRPYIIDEVTTPDSSRFCRHGTIVLGKEPPFLDKEVARIEAMRMWGDGPKVPLIFSPDTVATLTKTYLEIFERITGVSLEGFQRKYLS